MSLDTPLTINGMTMPNRTFFAPMTRRCADPNTRGPTEAVAQYYARRAAGGFGLIITEGVFVNDHNAMNKEMCPLCRTDEQIAMWKHVVDTCKAANPNVKMCMQLWHVGVWSIKPIAPSESPCPVTQNVKEGGEGARAQGATDAELDGIINDFIATAVNAVTKCGFDSVQIHGAHGYFVDIFSDVFYNRRKESEGASYSDSTVATRASFAACLTSRLRAALGPCVPILMRFSQWEAQDLSCIKFKTSEELKTFLYALQDAGADGFDVSTRLWSAPAFPSENTAMGLAAWCKRLLVDRHNRHNDTGATSTTNSSDDVITHHHPQRGPVVSLLPFSGNHTHRTIPAVLAVGGLTISRQFLDSAAGPVPDSAYALTDPMPCLEALAEGAFDGVGIGRCALTNPDWPNKVLAGKWRELKAFTDADKEYGQVDN